MPARKTKTNTTRTNRYSGRTHKTNRSSRTTRKTNTTSSAYACNSPKFNTPRTECQCRIGSYRNVYSQFNPTGTKTVFSPTAANKWTKYVNSGARVYKFTNAQFTRNFGSKWSNSSPTAARQYMRKKYGPAIKDVIRGKNNCWLVATTKNVTGRPFNNYNWK